MSKYTTEVRFICEKYAGLEGSKGYADVENIIASARGKVFNFSYPIFDEAYKPVLEAKILRHYYTKEICAETVGLWQHFLSRKMNEIMPYYNQLYKSELLEFNPLYDTEINRTHNGTSTGNESITGSVTNDIAVNNTNTITDKTTQNVVDDTSQSTAIATSEKTSGTNKVAIDETVNATNNDVVHSVNVEDNDETNNKVVSSDKSKLDAYSDTPQGGVTNLENNTYLTNARKIVDGEDVTDNTTINGTKTTTTDSTDDVTTASTKTGNNDTTVDMTVNGTNNGTINGTRVSDAEVNKTGTNVLVGTTSNDTNTTNNKDMNTVEEYLESVKGKQGGKSYSQLLKEFRETFLNIDMLVIDDLSDLFYNLW
jgi:hypothetical protein